MADYFLGEVLLYRGGLDEAAMLFERTLSAQRRIYGPANITVADTVASLAQVRAAQNDVREAERLIREVLDGDLDLSNAGYLQIGNLQTVLATVVIRQGRFVESEQLLRNTLDLYIQNLPPDHQYIASAEHYLGEALLGQRRYEEAEPILLAAIARWKRSGAPAWRAARSASTLGEVLRQQRRTQEAEALLVDSFRHLNTDAGADEDSKRAARERLTRLYKDLGKRQKLDALLKESAQPRTPAAKSPAKHFVSIAKVEGASSRAPVSAAEQ